VMSVSKLATRFCCAVPVCGMWVQTTSLYRVLDTHYRYVLDIVQNTVYRVDMCVVHGLYSSTTPVF